MKKRMNEYNYCSGMVMRAYFSSSQKEIISKNDNASRYVYNKCVEIGRELYQLKKVKVPVPVIQDRIAFLETLRGSAKEISNMAPFLNDPDVDSLAKANAVKNYNTGWNNYKKVKGTSIPTFHKKGYEKRYQTNAQYSGNDATLSNGTVRFLDRTHLRLPILGRVRVKASPKLLDALFAMPEVRIGTVTVCIDECGDGYISMQLASDYPFHKAFPVSDSMVGIDVNLENFYTTSDGEVVDNPHFAKTAKDKLAKEQWKLSRKMNAAKREGRDIRTSKNLQKQRVKTAKISKHVRNQRMDYQHVQSKKITESQGYIFAEDIKVKNLVKNHHLAYAISDVAWGSFLHMLDYKAKIYGRTFLKIDPKNTTQTCSCCGYVKTGENKLKLDDREWVCPQCGEFHIRDVNAAINILLKGMKALGLS